MNRKTWRTIYVLAKIIYWKGGLSNCRCQYKNQLENLFYFNRGDVLQFRVKYKLTYVKKSYSLGSHDGFKRHCSIKPKLP